MGEGNEAECFVLYEGSADELQIINDKYFPWKKWAIIRSHGTRWKVTCGIGIGTTLEELVQLNGGEFSFFGFGFDGSGHIPSWGEGKLAKGCSREDGISFNLSHMKRIIADDGFYFEYNGDVYSSSHPRTGEFDLRIGLIRVYLK